MHSPATANRRAPLGVFDSGLGGLTVVAALQQRLPEERIIYLGDTARIPYGTKSAATVVRYSLQIARFLADHGIKYIIAACNTASALALTELARQIPVPIAGVVEPGAQMAAALTRQGRIGVIGTMSTISSGAYHRALAALRSDLTVFGQACPLFVSLAEEGWEDHPVTAQVARHYLSALRDQSGDLDTIVLGCTHYPLLKKTIAAEAERVFGHPVALVDSAHAVASAVLADLRAKQLTSSAAPAAVDEHRFFFTDDTRIAELAVRFLSQKIQNVEHADL